MGEISLVATCIDTPLGDGGRKGGLEYSINGAALMRYNNRLKLS